MSGPDTAGWSFEEACVLTMLATNRGAMSAPALLLRSDGLLPSASWEAFAESMGRLVAAGLVSWLERRFFVSATGRAVAASGEGRYFKDLFADTQRSLDEQVARPEPLDLALTRQEYDEALAYVAAATEQRRTRRGYAGYRKWAEWKAPPLTLGDCIEFLTFIEGRDVVVKAEDTTDNERFEGTLGPPLPQSPDPHDQTSVTFPVHTSDSDPAARRLRLSADGFDTASYSSLDGVDYFTLRMSFDDNGIITVADANAPSI